MTAAKKFLIFVGVCVIVVTIGALRLRGQNALRSSDRRAWKEQAIAEISKRVADPAWPGREKLELRKRGAGDPGDSDTWLSERLILMQNGDWLAYANICRKQDKRIHDLFVARGSDGKWYYSTYHFCIAMVVLRMEDQSNDLTEFAKAYFLRPFDGRSDDCLQKTWPPAPK